MGDEVGDEGGDEGDDVGEDVGEDGDDTGERPGAAAGEGPVTPAGDPGAAAGAACAESARADRIVVVTRAAWRTPREIDSFPSDRIRSFPSRSLVDRNKPALDRDVHSLACTYNLPDREPVVAGVF